MVAHYLLFAARRNGRSDTYPAFISATAVLNIMVVFLYWRLYFIDPALVNGDNTPEWFQEYYLHLIGPALILIEALFISRAFDQMLRGDGRDRGVVRGLCGVDRGVCRPVQRLPHGQCNIGPDLSVPE